MHKWGFKGVCHTRLLGVDYATAKRRGTAVACRRLAGARPRLFAVV